MLLVHAYLFSLLLMTVFNYPVGRPPMKDQLTINLDLVSPINEVLISSPGIGPLIIDQPTSYSSMVLPKDQPTGSLIVRSTETDQLTGNSGVGDVKTQHYRYSNVELPTKSPIIHLSSTSPSTKDGTTKNAEVQKASTRQSGEIRKNEFLMKDHSIDSSTRELRRDEPAPLPTREALVQNYATVSLNVKQTHKGPLISDRVGGAKRSLLFTSSRSLRQKMKEPIANKRSMGPNRKIQFPGTFGIGKSMKKFPTGNPIKETNGRLRFPNSFNSGANEKGQPIKYVSTNPKLQKQKSLIDEQFISHFSVKPLELSHPKRGSNQKQHEKDVLLKSANTWPISYPSGAPPLSEEAKAALNVVSPSNDKSNYFFFDRSFTANRLHSYFRLTVFNKKQSSNLPNVKTFTRTQSNKRANMRLSLKNEPIGYRSTRLQPVKQPTKGLDVEASTNKQHIIFSKIKPTTDDQRNSHIKVKLSKRAQTHHIMRTKKLIEDIEFMTANNLFPTTDNGYIRLKTKKLATSKESQRVKRQISAKTNEESFFTNKIVQISGAAFVSLSLFLGFLLLIYCVCCTKCASCIECSKKCCGCTEKPKTNFGKQILEKHRLAQEHAKSLSQLKQEPEKSLPLIQKEPSINNKNFWREQIESLMMSRKSEYMKSIGSERRVSSIDDSPDSSKFEKWGKNSEIPQKPSRLETCRPSIVLSLETKPKVFEATGLTPIPALGTPHESVCSGTNKSKVDVCTPLKISTALSSYIYVDDRKINVLEASRLIVGEMIATGVAKKTQDSPDTGNFIHSPIKGSTPPSPNSLEATNKLLNSSSQASPAPQKCTQIDELTSGVGSKSTTAAAAWPDYPQAPLRGQGTYPVHKNVKPRIHQIPRATSNLMMVGGEQKDMTEAILKVASELIAKHGINNKPNVKQSTTRKPKDLPKRLSSSYKTKLEMERRLKMANDTAKKSQMSAAGNTRKYIQKTVPRKKPRIYAVSTKLSEMSIPEEV